MVQERLFGTKETLRDRSKRRWVSVEPNDGLTWGRQLTGDAFVSKVAAYVPLDDTTRVLEIGPGYGRLLEAWVRRPMDFGTYWAVDISASNVEWLTARFSDPRVHFLHADAETTSFDFTFDVVVSSLVFKHLFPSFEAVLRNVSKYLAPRAILLFDLREGHTRMFDPRDGVSYVRWYTREEITEILRAVGLELAAFDEVEHDPDHHRLLVVATRTTSPDQDN